MEKVDTVIHAGWIVTVDDHNAVLREHSVVIKNKKIHAIVPTDDVRNNYEAADERDLRNHIIMPGLINGHTHVPMNLFRGFADDLPLMTWLEEHIWPAEAKWVGSEFVEAGSRLAFAEMIRGGITACNDMYFFPEATAQVAIEVGFRAGVGMTVIDFPSAWAADIDGYFKKGAELYERFNDHPLIHVTFAPHAPYTVSEAPLKRIKTLADKWQLPINIHLHETATEVEGFLDSHGMRPIQHLNKLGLLSPSLIAVHMTQLTDGEIELLAETSTSVLHCPESNLKLASGFCPINKLVTAGINVGLGTDSAASNNDLDMFGEMKTAALLAKGLSGDATAIPAETVLRMATINNAKAMGIDKITGSLEVGKAADIIAIDTNNLETLPLYDPVAQIVYAIGRDKVTDVWIAGQAVMRERQLTTMDERALIKTLKHWQAKIADQ